MYTISKIMSSVDEMEIKRPIRDNLRPMDCRLRARYLAKRYAVNSVRILTKSVVGGFEEVPSPPPKK